MKAMGLTDINIRRSLSSRTTAQPSCVSGVDQWSFNHLDQSPCQVAALLYTPCGGANFDLPAITAGNSYTPGNTASPPTPCSCSWAVYNLLAACTSCQDTGDILTWARWASLCGSAVTNGTWYPPGFAIPSGTAVSFWAQQNPTNWTNERFDPSQASALAAQNQADSTAAPSPPSSIPTPTPGPTSPHSSTPIGAIAGGVLGGLALIAVIASLLWSKCLKSRVGAYGHKPIPSPPVYPLVQNMYSAGESFSKPAPGALVIDGEFDPQVRGQLGMTLRSNADGRTTILPAQSATVFPSHARTLSGDTAISLASMPLQHNPSPEPRSAHGRQLSSNSMNTSRMLHSRTYSGDSILSGLPSEAMITPWVHSPSPDIDSSASSEYITASAAQKAQEATRKRETSVSVPSNRRMNPPTYETALADAGPRAVSVAGSANRLSRHAHSASNDSNVDLSFTGGLSNFTSGDDATSSARDHSGVVPSSSVLPHPRNLRLANADESNSGGPELGPNGYPIDRKAKD